MTYDEQLEGLYQLLQLSTCGLVVVGYLCAIHGRVGPEGCPCLKATQPENKPITSTEVT